ncbi:uncharacterized protein LOC119189491 [Manduca sexta]|uniref:uncharacterized protein LOC119189491 n=1 Tax=Manduca sexta TaxID=7130 RepID=UPI00188F1775|nr:uncharacterized protein LOC119189491 [Manduca sexta]
MEYKIYNKSEESQADSNFAKHGPDLYGNGQAPEYNKEESEECIRVQQTLSGKTYCAASKSVLKERTRVFTPSENAFYDTYNNTKQNIQYNFNTAELSETYQFANMPSSSKQQNIPNDRNETVFESFKNKGITTFCEGNYPTGGNPNKYTEKSTYCRALFNNQEFVYRTLAKNARLQRLVRKLVCIRQKQKEEDLWNNYINELKNKHRYSLSENVSLQNCEELPSERIEDYYEKGESAPCRNLLKDFYTVHNSFDHSLEYRTRNNYQPRRNCGQYIFENQSLCYPTSSQGRLMMLNKERQQNQFANDLLQHPQHRHFRGNIIFADREFKRKNRTFRRLEPTKSTNTVDSQSETVQKLINNKSMQTDLRCLFPISEDGTNHSKVESTREKYKQVAKNVERLKRKLEKSNTEVKQTALDNIENKLNNLIQTLNTFMVDIRANSPFSQDSKSYSVSSRVRNNSLNELNAAKSDTYSVIKREEAICRAAHENTTATSVFLNAGLSTKGNKDKYMKIDKILNEEMDKSNKVKQDIEDIMYQRSHRPRAVQITFDIPTRERSTEVTNSLSKAKVQEASNIEEVGHPTNESDEKQMTIAVNTDPLGILGLLRISTEAVKQILSYMPHIDYYSYLSLLQFPQSRHGVPHYICNICGASFERPSQLSDHIQTHNLGYSRDCCVCRHVLDMKQHRPGLFKCRHCGQMFTRAYCCELHEETCARRLGVPRDVNSTVNLLQ